MKIGVGKFKGFMRISNDLGQFQMLALDQRNSLQKMITAQKGTVEDSDLVSVKRSILKTLSDKVSAVLVDGEYGFPSNLKYVSHKTGIILSAEKSGYVTDEKSSSRLSKLYREDVGVFAKKSGMDAVKLLVYWSDNASKEAKAHQTKIVEELGQVCLEEDILYILEILTYDVNNSDKEKAILNAMKVFSDERYKVDMFKVEPIVREAHFNLKREDVYDFSNGKPWVILSGGMDVEDFKDILKWNCQIGASGFLAGRVIWKEAPKYILSPELMDLHLKNTGIYNLELLKLNAAQATPFFKAPCFGGMENLELSL
ncbi:tagatose 1,6-diphosphate aldolase [Mesoaciditoga lauensis]|uniref:tagatose 1,6-diphosphate aldolase n=1 Tax=Mesoaciditoga lauensis TaxID=1495039 RepID=UPI0005628EFA|nr:tagatose 1,6-diphosphate aldolase [Mesoaciditoga lauensis]